jgi:hypothetical protein
MIKDAILSEVIRVRLACVKYAHRNATSIWRKPCRSYFVDPDPLRATINPEFPEGTRGYSDRTTGLEQSIPQFHPALAFALCRNGRHVVRQASFLDDGKTESTQNRIRLTRSLAAAELLWSEDPTGKLPVRKPNDCFRRIFPAVVH